MRSFIAQHRVSTRKKEELYSYKAGSVPSEDEEEVLNARHEDIHRTLHDV